MLTLTLTRYVAKSRIQVLKARFYSSLLCFYLRPVVKISRFTQTMFTVSICFILEPDTAYAGLHSPVEHCSGAQNVKKITTALVARQKLIKSPVSQKAKMMRWINVSGANPKLCC